MKTSSRSLYLSGVCALVALLASPSAYSALYDFNTPGQLTGDFHAGSQGSVGTQSASGGLDDSGWVTTNVAFNQYGFAVTNSTFAGDSTSIQLSIYFQWKTMETNPAANFGLVLGIGRSTDPDVAFNPFGGSSGLQRPVSTQALQWGIGPWSSPVGNDTVRLYGSNMVDGVNTNQNVPGNPSTTLVNGNWYYLEFNLTLLEAENGFAYTVALYNSDNSGVVSGSSLLSHSGSQVNAGLTDGELYAYFGVRDLARYGILGVDDFYVHAVPEPSAFVLVLPGLIAILILRRRHA